MNKTPNTIELKPGRYTGTLCGCTLTIQLAGSGAELTIEVAEGGIRGTMPAAITVTADHIAWTQAPRC